MKKQRIIVGLSGGVDSSVTAYLLKKQGHEVLGIFMQNWEDDNDDEYCSIKQDALDAMSVADHLDIDIEIINFANEYKERVFAYFLTEYQAGRTPNPDVLCNSEIKFSAFLDHALKLGADAIATGHYARTQQHNGQTYLLKARDLSKDQSYFLYRLQQKQLRRALFPLGELLKTQVRDIAQDIGLHNAAKKDSTGICFIGERPFRAFLQRYLPSQNGAMKTPEGRIVGEHIGLSFYTIGQRKGLGIGGEGLPWFVAGKDLENNELIVVQGHDHPLLLKQTLRASQCSWTLDTPPKPSQVAAKTRYRMQDAACELRLEDEAFCLNFKQPQWAITPGQSAVLYDGDICLGGGVIL